MKITIDADEDQIAIILTSLEGMMEGREDRGHERAVVAVEKAAELYFNPHHEEEFEYSVVKIAPIYDQLCRYAGKWSDETSILYAEDEAEFRAVLNAARAALGSASDAAA